MGHLKTKHNQACARNGCVHPWCPTCLALMRYPAVSPQCWLTVCEGGVPHTAANSPCQKESKRIKGDLLKTKGFANASSYADFV